MNPGFDPLASASRDLGQLN